MLASLRGELLQSYPPLIMPGMMRKMFGNQMTPSMHIGMVLLIAFAYWLVLRTISGLVWYALWMNQARLGEWTGRWGQVIPWPLLVLLFPVIVLILLALFARGDDGEMVPRRQSGPPVIQGEHGLSPWFQSYYSRARLFQLLKIITLVWGVIFMAQLIFWLGFRRYYPAEF